MGQGKGQTDRRDVLSRRIARLEQELRQARAELESSALPDTDPCAPLASLEQESVYRSLFEAMKEGFHLSEIICDPEGTPVDWRFLAVNPAFESMTGKRREEVVGQRYREVFPDSNCDYWVRFFGEVALTGEARQFESPDRGKQWQTVVYSPIKGQFAAIFNDVTDRVEAEERLQYVLRGIDVGVWDWNVARDEVTFSSRWQEILGYTEHPVVWPAKEWMELVHSEDLRVAIAAVQNHLEGKSQVYQTEMRVRHANGDWRWLLDRGVGVRDQQGAVYRMVGSHTDITDRKLAEHALRESEERYRLMVEASPVGYLLGNVDGSIRDANETLLRMIGYTRADLGALRWDTITPPEWLPVDEKHIAEARELGVCTPYEKEYWHRDGHRVPLLVGYALLGAEREHSAAFIVDLTELKKAKSELRVSQERFLLAQAAAGFGTWEWDLTTGRASFSDSCFALHGIAPHPDFGYSDWLACIDPQDCERIEAAIQESIRGDGIFDSEFRIQWPDGTVRWLNARGHVVRDAGGAPVRMALVSFDVTERRRTEQERQKLAAIIEQATDMIGLRDTAGRPIYLNTSGRRLLGIEAGADLRLLDPFDYFLADDREFIENTVFPTVLHEGAWQGEFRYRHQVTGAVVPVEMNMFTVRDASSGELIGLAAVSRDISERLRMEDALRKSEHYFRQLAESVPDVVFTSDPDGTVDYFNTRWLTYTGQTEGDARAWGWSSVLHPEDVSRCLDRWNRSLTTGVDYEIEYRLRNAYGKYRWFLGRARAFRGPDGAIQKWFGSCTDIDEQKFTEQALRRSNEQLQQFAHVATHDLQEPLRTIASFTELLQRERSLGASGDQYMKWVVEAANRMSNLIRDLLAYTLAAGQNEGYREPVAFELLLVSVLATLEDQMRANRAHVTHDPLPVLTVDRAQFEQVFQNLIGNALKFARPGEPSRIHVSARFEPGTWVFSVEDNGVGFDAVHAERIFGVFKRLHGRDVQGTGIGLAICKAIIERHGGKIWAQSRPAQGSTFWFTLPARSVKS